MTKNKLPFSKAEMWIFFLSVPLIYLVYPLLRILFVFREFDEFTAEPQWLFEFFALFFFVYAITFVVMFYTIYRLKMYLLGFLSVLVVPTILLILSTFFLYTDGNLGLGFLLVATDAYVTGYMVILYFAMIGLEVYRKRKTKRKKV